MPAKPAGEWSRPYVVAGAVLIVAAVLVAYAPAVSGGFLWDDDAHVTKPELRTAYGLYRIWFKVGATQQYYPLLHSAFWVQHQLWGDWPGGYHLVNITLHAVAAVLVILWFTLGAAAGLFTAWAEHDLIGAKGEAFELSSAQRLMLSGRVVWFYLYKLLCPAELIFIYPRWSVDSAVWWQWAFPVAAAAVLIVLYRVACKGAARDVERPLPYGRVSDYGRGADWRRRAPLAAVLFFIGSLFPVLGFFNVDSLVKTPRFSVI